VLVDIRAMPPEVEAEARRRGLVLDVPQRRRRDAPARRTIIWVQRF
jgi:hypothetical protein